MRACLAALLGVSLLLTPAIARSYDVETAPYLGSFGVKSPNPPGHFTMTIQNAVHDASGAVYTVEGLRVQKFDRDGNYLRSWACFSCSGIDVNQASGDVYVTLYDLHSIRRYSSNGVLLGSWGGFGSQPGVVRNPHGIAVDPTTGDVYVFDTGNGRVQVFDATGVYLRHFGQTGTGVADFSGMPSPGAVAFDAVNRVVYVTDPRIYQVKKFDENGSFIQKWGDPVGVAPGHFRWPRSVEVDGQGRVYVTDTDSERIQYFTPDGVYLGQFQGPNNVIDGAFHPRDIAINRLTGEKYVNAAYAFREDKFDADNQFVASWGGRDLDGPQIEAPHGIAVSPLTGDVVLLDSTNMLLKRFSAGGAFLKQWGGSNRIDVSNPALIGQAVQSALAVGPDGNIWTGMVGVYYASDPPGPWLTQFDPEGAVTNFMTRKPFASTYDEQVRDVAVEPTTGDIFVSDAIRNRLHRLTSTGTSLAEVVVPEAAGLAFVGGKLYAVDPVVNRVRRYDANLVHEATIGGPGSGDGELAFYPSSGVAVDASGRMFVADTNHHRVQQFNADGSYAAKRGGLLAGSGPGQFIVPMDVALSPNGDLLYVVDTYNHRVQILCLSDDTSCAAIVDPDADGRRDWQDNCPAVANANQANGDGDALGDACDPCPNDLGDDPDGDSVCGASDNCPAVANTDQTNADGDPLGDACDACPSDATNDVDADTICGGADNCPALANGGQENADGDGLGDACDACPNDAFDDVDADSACGDVDNCPALANADQANADGDALGDACDACPSDAANDGDGDGLCSPADNCPTVVNVGQENADGDASGDACDACPVDPTNDVDDDAACGSVDNCPFAANADQADLGGLGGPTPDGVGDACQCGDVASNGVVEAADLAAFRAWLADETAATGFDAPAKCGVSVPSTPCSILDGVVLQRALDPSGPLPPGIAQSCEAAGN